MTVKIAHGYNVKGNSDPILKKAEFLMEIFTLVMTPGRFLVDILPVCTSSESLRFISIT